MPTIDNMEHRADPWLVLLGLVSLTCAFFMMPVLVMIPRRPAVVVPLLLTIVGCVLAQGCILGAWLAWSDQPFWRRFRRHWIAASTLYLVWAAGLAVSRPSEFAPVSAFVGLSVPLVSFAAQSPLWLVRFLFGWRLIRGDLKNGAGREQVSIRDMMKGTLLIAVTLALSRLAPSPDGDELGMLWVVMFVVASVLSAITLLPPSALLMRPHCFQRGVMFAGIYAGCWLGVQWLVIAIGRQQGLIRLPPQPFLVGASCFIVSFATTVILAAAAARARGYRLAWGRIPAN